MASLFAPLFEESSPFHAAFHPLFGPTTKCAEAARSCYTGRCAAPVSSMSRRMAPAPRQLGALRLLQRQGGYLLLAEVGEDVIKQDIK